MKKEGLAADSEAPVGRTEVVLAEVGEELTEVAFEKEAGELTVELVSEPFLHVRTVGAEDVAGEAAVLVEVAKADHDALGAGELQIAEEVEASHRLGDPVVIGAEGLDRGAQLSEGEEGRLPGRSGGQLDALGEGASAEEVGSELEDRLGPLGKAVELELERLGRESARVAMTPLAFLLGLLCML